VPRTACEQDVRPFNHVVVSQRIDVVSDSVCPLSIEALIRNDRVRDQQMAYVEWPVYPSKVFK